MSKFLSKYSLGLELHSSPPIVIKEAEGPKGKRYIVKIFCKGLSPHYYFFFSSFHCLCCALVGFSESDVRTVLTELNFWLTNPHPALTPIIEVIQEDPFIYIVYGSAEGGTLEMAIFATESIFSEGFAKFVTVNLLEGLAFLHRKGVVHELCTPANICFKEPKESLAWMHSAQLSTLRVNYNPAASPFSDLKDLAYTVCAILRRGSGIFSRVDFNPIILSSKEWSFVTPEFVTFITELWNSDKLARGAEYFMEHAWLGSTKKTITKKDIRCKKGWVMFKINSKKSPLVRRKWVKAFGRVEASVCMLSADEEGLQGPGDFPTPLAFDLRHTEMVITVSRYNFSFALQKKAKKEIILWLRFENQVEFDEFKLAMNEFTDPAINAALELGRRKSVASSMSGDDTTVATSEGQTKKSIFGGLLGKEAEEMFASKGKGNEDRRASLERRMSVELAANPLRSLVWDHNQKTVAAVDTASAKLIHSLQSQGIVYRRNTAIRCGWSYGKGGSLAPYPSAKRCSIHPGKKWDDRVNEFLRIKETGVPLSADVEFGEEWFIVDASWFRHWKTFISSKRRMVPPGPIGRVHKDNYIVFVPFKLS